jgi:hypothetical protein
MTATLGEAVGVLVGRSSSAVVGDAEVRTNGVRAGWLACPGPKFVCTMAVGSSEAFGRNGVAGLGIDV